MIIWCSVAKTTGFNLLYLKELYFSQPGTGDLPEAGALLLVML